MLPQAQEMMTSQIAFDVPFGMLLALALLVVLASGVVFESGLFGMMHAWLAGHDEKLTRRVATAGHRS